MKIPALLVSSGLLLLSGLLLVPSLARGDDETKGDAAPVGSRTGGPKVGDPAPSFVAKNQKGVLVKLEDWRGKRVVLWFYPKADTGG